MRRQRLRRPRRLRERARAVRVKPVQVVRFFVPVHRQAHEKMVLAEKRRPFAVNPAAVGLYGIVRGPSARVGLLKPDQLPEKVQPRQRRLPALKGKRHIIV